MFSYKLCNYNPNIMRTDTINNDQYVKKSMITDIISHNYHRSSHHIHKILNDVPPHLITYEIKRKIIKQMKYVVTRKKACVHKQLKECLIELSYNDILPYI